MTTYKILFLSFFIYSSTLLANEGLELHQSDCIECHSKMTGGDGSVLYAREDTLVRSMTELESRVHHCANGAKTGWNETQIESVSNYLNQTYYHY